MPNGLEPGPEVVLALQLYVFGEDASEDSQATVSVPHFDGMVLN